MRKILWALIALIVAATLDSARAAGEPDCYTTFYRTKDIACVDGLVNTIRKLDAPSANQPNSDPQAIVGFLAQLFTDQPQQKTRILSQAVSLREKSIYSAALYRAGLLDEAKKYADAIGRPDAFNRFSKFGLSVMKQVRPVSNPGDNDLLIGAFMASGNTEYIARVLENFTGAEDGMASDAFRIGLMQTKFGPTLVPKGRENAMMPAACQKYECKTNINALLRVMTLATGFWATSALTDKDDAIKKTFVDFFRGDQRLQRLLVIERNAFSNYVVTLAVFAAVKDNPNINASLSIYEKLGRPEDALSAMKKKD